MSQSAPSNFALCVISNEITWLRMGAETVQNIYSWLEDNILLDTRTSLITSSLVHQSIY